MNKQNAKILILATPLIIVCGLLASGASAMAQSTDRHCSYRTLSGDYGLASEGLLIGIPGLPPEAPYRSVGVAHFDGKGSLTWVEHTVENGIPLNLNWLAAIGTYTVNSDCTGTAVVNTPNRFVPLNLAFVVVRQGTEIHSVLDGNAIATVFIKVE
jgi:hypothetical protein